MFVQSRQLRRHFAVLRHHVHDTDQCDDGGIHRADEQKSEHNADENRETVSEPRAADQARHNVRPRKRSMSSLWRASSGANDLGATASRSASKAVPSTTSTATGRIAFVAVRVTFGCSAVESGSSFITPVILAIASTPLSARITPDELDPGGRQRDVTALEMGKV